MWQSIDWVGAVAATLTTLCFLPQTIKAFREKDTRSISLWMYLLFTIGVGFWLVYGILIGSWPMIISNAIVFFLSFAILVMKRKYG